MNNRIESPLIAEADILIIEGTIAACAAALRFATEGKKVIICISGTSLPFEIAACRRQDFTPHYPDESFIGLNNVKGLLSKGVFLHGPFAEFRISFDHCLNDPEFLSCAFQICHEVVQASASQLNDKLFYRVPDNILFATAPLKIKTNPFCNLHICEHFQNLYSRLNRNHCIRLSLSCVWENSLYG